MSIGVTTDLPFDFCSICIMHDFNVGVTDIYSNGQIYEREIKVYCQNEHMCEGLYNTIKGQLEANNDCEDAH